MVPTTQSNQEPEEKQEDTEKLITDAADDGTPLHPLQRVAEPRFGTIAYNGRSYSLFWTLGLFLLLGLCGEFVKRQNWGGQRDNILTRVLDWFSSKGIAIILALAILPPLYLWFEESKKIVTSAVVIWNIVFVMIAYLLVTHPSK